jgi:hypothetical protein
MRILAIGVGAEDLARMIYPDATIDVSRINVSKKNENLYDALLSRNALQMVENAKVVDVLKRWYACLKQDSEIHVFVPSLEWAAEQILAEDPSPLLLYHLFGGQKTNQDVNKSGFTMRRLRAEMDRAGIPVTHASVGNYEAIINNQVIVGEQHLVIGIKGNPSNRVVEAVEDAKKVS